MVFLKIDLQPVRSVLQYRKASLAEAPEGNDASRKGTGDLLFFQNFFGFPRMELDQLTRTILHIEACAVGRHTCLTQSVDLLDALLLLFVQFVHMWFRCEVTGRG